MRPTQFEYLAPSSLAEALSLLSATKDAKLLAGGQSLIPLMKLRLAAPSSLVDINRIEGLNYIREKNGSLAIGALSTHDQIATSSLVREKCPLLSEAASRVADQQVRNRGTIGGSLAHADPSADLPTACTALNAEIRAVSRDGSRVIPADSFFVDFFTTSLREDEIIEEIDVPIQAVRSGAAYRKLNRGHNDFALVSVAALMSLSPDDSCQRLAVAIGGVAKKPILASETERTLLHRQVDAGGIHDSALKAAQGLDPTPDPRATPDVKRRLVVKLTEETLKAAYARSHGAA